MQSLRSSFATALFFLIALKGQVTQRAINMLEEMFPQAVTWELATILEEERNCYLYEKMGYIRTGKSVRINKDATQIFYKKTVKGINQYG